MRKFFLAIAILFVSCFYANAESYKCVEFSILKAELKKTNYVFQDDYTFSLEVDNNKTINFFSGEYEMYTALDGAGYVNLENGAIMIWFMFDGDIEIEAGGNISFYTDQKKESQMLMHLPAIKNGESKIECTLWYDPITKTLKAEPINKITCGGFE